MHTIDDIQTKRRSLDHYIRQAVTFADKKDYHSVRLMFANAEQEMRYLERETDAARMGGGLGE